MAPIALYPDPLLAQVLAASTYPLEIVQLKEWLSQHSDLKDQALVDAVEKQDWDASVQALAPLPDVVKLLASDIQWTTDLGNAFLAQQADVTDAIQRMRAKAAQQGNLKSSDQIKVQNQTMDGQTVVVIEQANPQVIYVPSYNPAVVYGPAVYPYPAIAYPPVGAYAAGAALTFGVGIAMGAAFRGGWGYGFGWGGSRNTVVNVNTRNTFVSSNRVSGARAAQNRGQWQHNPQHRGGAPYANQATANRFGGNAARAQQGAGAARGGGPQGNAAAPRGAAAGADHVGNRSVPAGGQGGNAFGGGSHAPYSGSEARSSSARGGASAGAHRGAGFRGGGRR